MIELSFEGFVRAHGLGALNSIQKACEVLNIGHSRFYDHHVKTGLIRLIPNGSRRNVTAENLYVVYSTIIAEASKTSEAT